MFASRTHRHTVICATVCALLPFALTGGAPASANDRTHAAAALANERYYSSYGEPETIVAGTAAAQAQERYYSSYGEPASLAVAQSHEPSDDTPWPLIALSLAAALTVVAASATRARGRRAARVTT